jgi:hypothetical protein
MNKKNQVAITRLRTGYTRAAHGYITDSQENMECPFCNVEVIVDHMLWNCKETETQRRRMKIAKKIWTEGKNCVEKLIQYVKKIGFYQGI